MRGSGLGSGHESRPPSLRPDRARDSPFPRPEAPWLPLAVATSPRPGGGQPRSPLPTPNRNASLSASAQRELSPGCCGHWPPTGLTFA
jgi:hypothetical protein